MVNSADRLASTLGIAELQEMRYNYRQKEQALIKQRDRCFENKITKRRKKNKNKKTHRKK